MFDLVEELEHVADNFEYFQAERTLCELHVDIRMASRCAAAMQWWKDKKMTASGNMAEPERFEALCLYLWLVRLLLHRNHAPPSEAALPLACPLELSVAGRLTNQALVMLTAHWVLEASRQPYVASSKASKVCTKAPCQLADYPDIPGVAMQLLSRISRNQSNLKSFHIGPAAEARPAADFQIFHDASLGSEVSAMRAMVTKAAGMPFKPLLGDPFAELLPAFKSVNAESPGSLIQPAMPICNLKQIASWQVTDLPHSPSQADMDGKLTAPDNSACSCA